MIQTPKNICVMCREMYDTKDITFEQRLIADESFCPDCWDRQIMKMIYEEEDEMEFVKLYPRQYGYL